MTDKTAKKPPEQDKKTGRFLTGNIGGGRPQGARAKLGEAFLADMHADWEENGKDVIQTCLLYTSPSPRDRQKSRMPSSA